MLWRCKMPLKQRLFLWRCLIGTLSMGVTLAKRHIAPFTCFQIFLGSISRVTFGKHFWLFGRFVHSLSQYSLFFSWVRYWALWIIWNEHNLAYLGQQNHHSYKTFRASLRQSLYDTCHEGDMDASCIELFCLCF